MNYQQAVECQTSQQFGIMIPGYLSFTSFKVIDNYHYLDLCSSSALHSIGFFLTNPLPDNQAACLYYSKSPFDGISFIGAIANQRPSDIFPTSFNKFTDEGELIKLVIVIQPITEEVMELVNLTNNNQNKLKYSLTIAQNLYNFMTAYNKEVNINGQMTDILVTPVNVLQIWMQKFSQKYKENPNFIYNTTN